MPRPGVVAGALRERKVRETRTCVAKFRSKGWPSATDRGEDGLEEDGGRGGGPARGAVFPQAEPVEPTGVRGGRRQGPEAALALRAGPEDPAPADARAPRGRGGRLAGAARRNPLGLPPALRRGPGSPPRRGRDDGGDPGIRSGAAGGRPRKARRRDHVRDRRRDPAPPPPVPPVLARAKAAELWDRLSTLPERHWRWILEEGAEYQTWSMCERFCEESLRAGRRDAGKALELAELALTTAERAPGTEAERHRRQGYAWAFVAHAHQAAGERAEAEEAFRLSEALWRVG